MMLYLNIIYLSLHANTRSANELYLESVGFDA